jgi:hypothetical protein
MDSGGVGVEGRRFLSVAVWVTRVIHSSYAVTRFRCGGTGLLWRRSGRPWGAGRGIVVAFAFRVALIRRCHGLSFRRERIGPWDEKRKSASCGNIHTASVATGELGNGRRRIFGGVYGSRAHLAAGGFLLGRSLSEGIFSPGSGHDCPCKHSDNDRSVWDDSGDYWEKNPASAMAVLSADRWGDCGAGGKYCGCRPVRSCGRA